MDFPRSHEVIPEVGSTGEVVSEQPVETKPISEPPKELPAESEFQKIISSPTEATETTVADNFAEPVTAGSESVSTAKSTDPTSGASWEKELSNFTNQTTEK